jgi:hypothetical protein
MRQEGKNSEMHRMTIQHVNGLRVHVDAFIEDRLAAHDATVKGYEAKVSPA